MLSKEETIYLLKTLVITAPRVIRTPLKPPMPSIILPNYFVIAAKAFVKSIKN
jgi:hypothetical protein